ncbi:MAG: 4-hydroxy-tetrahydrodipicolinate reductase, partial [Candidatus Omnitrophota bacterium]
MVRIGISGVCGRMGRRIAALACENPAVRIAAAFEREDAPEIGRDLGEIIGGDAAGVKIGADLEKGAKDVDCLIEFTLPGPTLGHLAVCRKRGVPIVIGTTGFSAEEEKTIAETAKEIPVVFSPNMAVGVNLLFDLVRQAARVLGADFDIRIDETHHVHKKDSPSGTAKMIAKVIAASAGKDVPIEARREGEVIGNHGIVFDGKYETLEIRHDAKSRDVFAAGAVKAAIFLADKGPGLYSMADVLGLGKREHTA